MAKLAVLDVAPETRQEWTDEVADKHIAVMHRMAHNVNGSKILAADSIARVWRETVTDVQITRAKRTALRSPKYIKLRRINKNLNAVLEPGVAEMFAEKLRIPGAETDDLVAECLVSLLG